MKRTLLLFALFLSFFCGFAQTLPKKDTTKSAPKLTSQQLSELLPQITPKSPEAAALAKFGEYPVNLSSGLPAIEIPIYEISVGQIRVPIVLKYHPSGVKVGEVASSVGIGWALDAGGQVSRNTVEREDELGYLTTGVPNFLANPTSYCNLRQDIAAFLNANNDTGADVFTYNTVGTNGRFLLRPEVGGIAQQPYVLPDEKILVILFIG